MGILGALSTSVAGLAAQSYALENISGNIANSSTIGFKRVETSFVDLVPDQPVKQQISGSVTSMSALTNTIQGTLSSTGVATNMALSGDGYFVVAANNGSSSSPSFTGTNLYTRRGDFTTTANGYLTNGSGYYLSGTSYDPQTGSITGASTAPMKLSTSGLAAQTTSTVSYQGNLPSTPTTTKSANGGSNLLVASDFTTDPTAAGTGTVTGNDNATFQSESIDGGQVTVYNAAGTESTLKLRWGKTSNTSGSETWELFYQTDAKATGTDVAWQNVGSDFKFKADGTPDSSNPSSVTVSPMTINGTNLGDVKLDFSGGLTQYANANGTATPTLAQNGFQSGTLSSYSIASDGRVIGSYSNGQTATLGQVTIAHFASNDTLKRETGGAFSATVESGEPTYGLDGTTLTGGSVEASNTDISDEFSKMIVTQQAYSANTKILSTAQQMLQDVINIIR